MDLPNNLIKSLFHLRSLRRLDFIDTPFEDQEEIFQYLIRKAKNTVWGKKYSYSSIRTYKDFAERVPVNNYNDLQPYIDRMIAGEKNVLWPARIKWFAKTSGTDRHKSKLIPVSKEALSENHFKASQDLLSFYCEHNPETKIFSGKGLVMGGAYTIDLIEKTRISDLSAILLKNMPLWGHILREPSLDIAIMSDWEKKVELIARSTMDSNITYLAGMPSWMLFLMKRVLEVSGESNLLNIWPELELYIHGGTSFLNYKDTFRELYPKEEMRFWDAYNSSEGFFGIQDRNRSSDFTLLTNHGIFYEFISLDDYFGENYEKIIPLRDVEVGKEYVMIISTNSGMWRYYIGDTVSFESLSPVRFVLTGRIRQFLNSVGERLTMENAERAINAACQKTGAVVNEFTVAPFFATRDHKGYHQWVIEFEVQPEEPIVFGHVLDETIKQINSDYETKRYKDLILGPPEVHSVKVGAFIEWLKKKEKFGGQHKIPRLSQDSRIIRELMSIGILE